MKKAFTIIETLVALGIFAVAVLAILGYYIYTIQVVRNARQLTTATFLNQGLIEEAVSEPYDSLTVETGAKTAFTTDPANSTYPYTKQINVSLIDMNLNASVTDLGLKKIDCFVYWQGLGSEKKVQISTIVSRK